MRSILLLLAAALFAPSAHAETLYIFGKAVVLSPTRELRGAPVASDAQNGDDVDIDSLLAQVDTGLTEGAVVAPLVRPAPREEQRLISFPLVQVSDDEVEIRGGGLSARQVEEAMDDLGPALRACVPDRSPASGSLHVTVSVAQDGRITSVEASEGSRLPPAISSCAQDVLRGAAFPAHEQADGFTFGYDLRFGF